MSAPGGAWELAASERRPVVETWEQRTTLAVKPGMDYGIQVASEGYGSLILRFRADEVKPEEKAAPR